MTDCRGRIEELAGEIADPRITGEHLRCVDHAGELGSVLLIGVVHDHPASEYRVNQLVNRVDPDVLAVELPPLAIDLFSQYADDPEVPPQYGGEMSIAIQAADGLIAGIDAPSRQYLRLLLSRWRTGVDSPSIALSVLNDLLRMSAHAIATKLGALLGRFSGHRPLLYSPIRYDSSTFDSPGAQATHEASHLQKRDAFLRAIEQPRPIAIVDDLRETAMVERITSLRASGDVLVVLGLEHLEPVAKQLEEATV